MGWFKKLLIEVENCGLKGMKSHETFNFIKEKYSYADFTHEDFKLDGIIYNSWMDGYYVFIGKTCY